jgi:hypothetical protein
MKKVLAGMFLFGACLFAADFWVAKPAAEWSDKDLQKMMSNSPWAKPFSVPMSGPSTQFGNAQGNSGADPGNPAPISEGGGGGRGGGRGGGGGSGGASAAGAGAAPAGGGSLDLVARWQSAMPMKQAFVRMKYGAQASVSEEAKQTLDRVEPGYMIIVSGNLRPFMRTNPEGFKKVVQDSAVLSVKGKEPVKLEMVDVSPQQIIFLFSKTTPITLDDKEVDFTTKVADVVLKYKFKLKDMVVNGKLEI